MSVLTQSNSISKNLSSNPPEIVYPESDGKPIAENTEQFEWIERIKGGCEILFAQNPDVFVAADLFWYPVEGRPDIRVAPDTLIAFDRPKGRRGSYKQWEEGGVAPQVVFEILSPSNSVGEMTDKFLFYDRYRVEEYYLYDPERREFAAWTQSLESGRLERQELTDGVFISPRLGIRFDCTGGEFAIYHPDGQPFRSMVELAQERDTARQQIEAERERAEAERERAERMAQQLRELGVEPKE
jgi:Uma2 family endonuclease